MHRLSRLSLQAAALLLATTAAWAAPEGPHFDRSKFLDDCTACHVGHGMSGTVMLARETEAVCLNCHSAEAQEAGRKAELGMTSFAQPADIASELSKVYVHRNATCDDCHSVHGVVLLDPGGDELLSKGIPKPSPKRGFDSEADLCLSCHDGGGGGFAGSSNIAALVDPSNPSYHPLLAPAGRSGVPSVFDPFGPESMVNCSDCHANDDSAGPRGPHGSRVQGLLAADLALQSGSPESATTYALCYACHDRSTVLENDPFPYHEEHVVEARAACSQCHNPHGATAARSLIRFNEEGRASEATPSSSGRLSFESDTPGSGICYLSCHGRDHNPEAYGLAKHLLQRPKVGPLESHDVSSNSSRR